MRSDYSWYICLALPDGFMVFVGVAIYLAVDSANLSAKKENPVPPHLHPHPPPPCPTLPLQGPAPSTNLAALSELARLEH